MEKKGLLKQMHLAQQVEMQFDEAVSLFSDETLSSMTMSKAVGGINSVVSACNTNCPCPNGICPGGGSGTSPNTNCNTNSSGTTCGGSTNGISCPSASPTNISTFCAGGGSTTTAPTTAPTVAPTVAPKA